MKGAGGAAGPVIRLEHVTRTLDGELPVTLVKDVSLQIERGEFVCVMGPSGSGKSSLLYLLGLLDVPTQGRIWIDGQDTSGFDEDRLADFRLARMGYVFQFHFLLQEFSALDNVCLPIRKLGRLADEAAQARAAELLDQFGLKGHHQKRPSQLSGGQRQRVAIARALANDPLVILADEPTGNLDSAASANVRDILRDLTRQLDKSVVAVTHDADFASAADRRIGIVDGRIDMAWRPEPAAL
jgi:lipoprotein-releasing system ATP-binding protein